MKVTKSQLKDIILGAIQESSYNSMSPRGRSLANSIKGKFIRLYPDAKVGVDGRGGWITVNGKKAVDMSQATGRGMTDEEMIEMMHTAYAETHVDDDVGTEARRGSRPGEHKLDFGKDIGTYNYQNEDATQTITADQLREIIKEEVESLEQDLTKPIPIDDLKFTDDEGYGGMMFPGNGFSYTVREPDFEAEKEKLKKRYGKDVMISVPDPRYPKSRKIHSAKFDKAKESEINNFNRHQKMMSKRLGREPGLGS